MSFEDVLRLVNATLGTWCLGLTCGRFAVYLRDYRQTRDDVRFVLTTSIIGELLIFLSVVYGNIWSLVLRLPVSFASYVICAGLGLLAMSLPAIVKNERQILRNWDRRTL